VTTRGVVYVAYGQAAKQEAALSIASLKWKHDWPVTVIDEARLALQDPGGRWAKLNALEVTPWESVLYIDADSRIRGDLSGGFRILDDGWDMAICPSTQQGGDLFWHVGDGERQVTLYELGYEPLQLQGGLWFVKRNERVLNFFAAWRCEYLRFKDQDQAAFLRALAAVPLKVWLLGFPWNSSGGSIVEHRHGFLRRHQ
jgi:hypothetical protein